MTEYSYYWDGLITGDATLAPYTAARYTTNWKILFTREDDEGIISYYENTLEVSGISGGVIVDIGAALVEGYFYENTSQVTVTIPTPVTNPRIDRIVLRKDSALQTVRIYRVAGTEAGVPTAPALTQTTGGIFEIPLAQVYITTAGVITVTDERDYCWTPLIPTGPGMTEIETIVSDGTESSIDFLDIPQIYKHLKVIGSWRGTVHGTAVYVWLNGDTTAGNYCVQALYSDVSNNVVASALNNWPLSNQGYVTSFIANEPVGFKMEALHYVGPFYKALLAQSTLINAFPPAGSTIKSEGALWKNTDPIERITLTLSGGVFVSGTTMTLFGSGFVN